MFVTQSQNSFCRHIFDPLPPLPPPPPSFPSGNHHTAICVCEFLFICLVCSFVAYSFISHVWGRLCGSWHLPSDLFCLAWYSQVPSILFQMAVFHLFLWLSSVSLYVCTTVFYRYLSKDTLVVFISWPPKNLIRSKKQIQ